MDNNPTNTARRNLLKNVGLVTAAASAGLSFKASAEMEMDHSSHGQMHMMHHMHSIDTKRRDIFDNALDCVNTGELCGQHCVEMFQMGDTTLTDCYASVKEMLAVCTALSKMVVQNAKHLNEMIELGIRVCEECETECRKHEDTHMECRACAESCADCIDACKAYLA